MRYLFPAAVAVTAVLLSACGGAGARAGSVDRLTVLAAASLTESFSRIGAEFENGNPGVEVTFSFGGSSGLARQIVSGAPADVFAAADRSTMATVTDAGEAAGPPVTFARNRLVIAVPNGNPRRIAAPADLAEPGLTVAACAEQVPCGAAAATALRAAGVRITPVTREPDVKAALAKLKLGEVDAALVYGTDARAADDEVDAVEFPESAQAINDYPIVALKNAADPAHAAAFVAFVRSAPAQRMLADAGFEKP